MNLSVSIRFSRPQLMVNQLPTWSYEAADEDADSTAGSSVLADKVGMARIIGLVSHQWDGLNQRILIRLGVQFKQPTTP